MTQNNVTLSAASGTSPRNQLGLQWAFVVQMSQTQLPWRSHKNHLKKQHPGSSGGGGPPPQIDTNTTTRSTKSHPYRGNYLGNRHRGAGSSGGNGSPAAGGGNRNFHRPRSNSLGLPKQKRAFYGYRTSSKFESTSRQKENTDQHNFEDQQHICQLHSDTLDKCLEKSGIYVCKSYAPRCFIIQKVGVLFYKILLIIRHICVF